MNPFLATDYFPRFSELTPEAATEAIRKLAEQTATDVAALEKNCTPTWEGRVQALTDILEPLGFAWHLLGHMTGVCNNDAWRKAEEELQPLVVRTFLAIGQSRPLYDALRALRDSAGFPALEEGKRRVIEAELRDARDSGVGLDGAQKERFNEIAARLAELSTKFSNNTLDATKAFSLVLRAKEDVAGLPPAVLALLSESYKGTEGAGPTSPEAGPWRVTLEAALYGPFLQYSERRDLREKLYRARATRASSAVPETDNGPILREILALRREQASLLGFPSYARLALDSRMAKDPSAVYGMIDSIGAPALDASRRELDELRAFAARHGFTEALANWDLAYWQRRLQEENFGYSSETLRPYFQFPIVLRALFDLAHELFGVSIEEADGLAPVWHPDVRFFRVRDEDGADRAYFYLDPYSRPASKQGGAWMDELRGRRRNPDGSVRLPLALLCCNQAPAAEGKPSLMTLGDVETLFHEFGHALQGMLTTVDLPQCSGISCVEWDAVELASQFLENWCVQPETLHRLSDHVDTHEHLPEDLVGKIRAAQTFCQGLFTTRQLSFALVDMDLHEKPDADPDRGWSEAAARFSPLPPIEGDAFLHTFTHIFSGGYAAGYYSYMWADVLAHDAFAAFEEAGLADPAARARTGRRYAATILALGGSRAPADVFRDFRGRDPDPAALLRHKGLVHA